MNGVLLLDKPKGITSMRAVERVKRALGVRKAGHTGTLDPLATGVLAICLGQATKVAGLLLASRKGYQAEMTLGATTNTLDSEGEVLVERPIPPTLDEDRIAEVLARYVGPQEQVPPAFSALRIKGKRAHELARAGEEVTLDARPIEVFSMALGDVVKEAGVAVKVSFSCDVSKGTYIRSLIRDIGEELSCGAYMSALRRTSVGHFQLEDTLNLEELEESPEEALEAIVSLVDAMASYPSLAADKEERKRLENGLISYSLQAIEPKTDKLHRVLREDGSLLALLEPCKDKPAQHWKVHKIFA